MSTKQEVVKTLSALAGDYSELIAERKKADMYFSEAVPQPKLFKKIDGDSFYKSDCEKMVNGKYKLYEEGDYYDELDADMRLLPFSMKVK